MTDRDTGRRANLRYLEEHSPHVFSTIDSDPEHYTDPDIEQLARYVQWLHEQAEPASATPNDDM
ncbi:MAG: hypothetical protein NVS2B16_23790 [Chloroflexota bacterium]